MKSKKPRKYDMTARSESAAHTEKAIMDAAAALWLKYPIHEITLERIAALANISVRTILRKYGSKEGLFEAGLSGDIAGIESIKEEAIAGDLDSIVRTLMKEYEMWGMAGIRTLAVEHELPIAAKVLQKGRSYHRKWCERVFAPYLPNKKGRRYDLCVGAFYCATDVNSWKLLRIDLGYSKAGTEEIFRITLNGIINEINQ